MTPPETHPAPDLNHQIQALLDQAHARGVQVRVQWRLTHDAAEQTLTEQRPVSVTLGRDRIDHLSGKHTDIGTGLEVTPVPGGRGVLTALVYRAGDEHGPQQVRLEAWEE